jgi:hypothetical protein
MAEIDIEKTEKPGENAETQAAPTAAAPVEGVVGTANEIAAEPEKDKPAKPMSYSAKLCLTVTLSSVILAVLFAAGVFDRFYALVNYMIADRPVPTVLASAALSGLLSLALSALLPKQLGRLAHAPFLAISYYWVGLLWYSTLDGKLLDTPFAITPSSLAAVLLAVAALTFCLFYHDEDKIGTRVVGFFYMFLVFSMFAFGAVSFVNYFVLVMKEESGQAVASELEVPVRVTEVIRVACPLAYSADYCDLVNKVVTSPEYKVRTRW